MFKRGPLREIRSRDDTPPPPHPWERLDWRGFYKKCLQNLESKRVKGQNLENKGVAASSETLSQAASALTIICSLRMEGQGQMSQEAVDRCCNLETSLQRNFFGTAKSQKPPERLV
jgi:hypothetical protein